MFFGLFWGDWTLLILLPAMIFAIIAQVRVKSTFNKYAKVYNRRGLTGAAAARQVLDANGLRDVRVERIRGELTDHYDPRDNVIRLSDSVYDSTGIAAVGVAAHEAGHAIQYAQNYAPINVRAKLIKVTNVGSMLSMPLFFIGLIMASPYLTYLGIALYSLVAIFQLVTLPVEFDASGRALKVLSSSGILNDDELKASKKVLSAAAMTYVAALAMSLAQLLRLILRYGGNRRR